MLIGMFLALPSNGIVAYLFTELLMKFMSFL